MGTKERWVVLSFLLVALLYVPVFAWVVVHSERGIASALIPVHIFVGAHGWVVVVLSLRDLHLRPATDPNWKMHWTLIILLTAGIGLAAYFIMHGRKPRSTRAEHRHTRGRTLG